MVTRYEYEDGLLVGSVEEREPEWSREDVESLIAFVEASRVGSHGQPMSEATSELANPRNPDRQWDYEVDVYTDFAKQRQNQAMDAFKKAYGDDANMQDLVWVVKRVDLGKT